MLEIGKEYKRVDGGMFSFGEKTGSFIGYEGRGGGKI